LKKSSIELKISVFWAILTAHIAAPKTIKSTAKIDKEEKKSEIADRKLTLKEELNLISAIQEEFRIQAPKNLALFRV